MQTRATAKNSFSSGLIMDFAPDNTQADILTNALNATFLTFNGNEMSLLNDMGNGRVESAFLPEGYIPVGTCEFGDIIYIVSYNPLEGKSLIGCFPSPERNISNKEISDLELSISASELAERGNIQSYSVKKIIFGNTNINSGDKFIVSWGDDSYDNQKYISNYGNTSGNIKDPEAYWPKITKISIVSINDSGKITYIDSNVKWYKNNVQDADGDFIISDQKFLDDNGADTTFNLDQYRNALQCQYSVFQENTSGKLALLLELETIKGFSCTHKVFKNITNSGTVKYNIYLSTSWDTDNFNINPSGILITNSETNKLNIEYDSEQKLKIRSLDERVWRSADRMIPFTRLYDLANPPSTYDEFKLKSYYTQIKDNINFELESLKLTNKLEITLYFKDISTIYEKRSNGCWIVVLETDTKDINKIKQTSGKYVPQGAKNITKDNFMINLGSTEWTGVPKTISDDIVVNHFRKSVLKYVGDVTLPSNASEGTLTYTVCPCMPYGPLDYLAITNTITIKENSEYTANLTRWRYYVNQKSITLNFGFEEVIDEEKAIGKVKMEFYDLNGLCAAYYLEDQESYNGQFTEYLELNLTSSNYRMRSTLDPITDPTTHKTEVPLIYHPGQVTTYGEIKDKDENIKTKYCYVKEDTDPNDNSKIIRSYIPLSKVTNLTDESQVCYNDAGILYSGIPYLVKITAFIKELNNTHDGWEESQDCNPFTFYRWLWTAPVFNDYYLDDSKLDFEELSIDCNVDFTATLDGKNITQETFTYYNSNMTTKQDTLGAQIDAVNVRGGGDIIFKGNLVLEYDYGGSIALDAKYYNDIITINTEILNQRVEIPETTVVLEDTKESVELNPIKPVKSNEGFDSSKFSSNLNKILGIGSINSEQGDLYSHTSRENESGFGSYTSVNNYTDMFTLKYGIQTGVTKEKCTVSYQNTEGNKVSYTGDMYRMSCQNFKEGIPIQFKGIKFNKILAYSSKTVNDRKMLVPLLSTKSDLDNYGLAIRENFDKGSIYFKHAIFLGLSNGSSNGYYVKGLLEFNDNEFYKVKNGALGVLKQTDGYLKLTSLNDSELNLQTVLQDCPLPIFPVVFGYTNVAFPVGQYINRSTEELFNLMNDGEKYNPKINDLKDFKDSDTSFAFPTGFISAWGNRETGTVPFPNYDWFGGGIPTPISTKLFANLALRHNCNLFSTLCYKKGSSLYCTADASIVKAVIEKNDGGTLTLDFPIVNKEVPVKSYALALGSLLMQIYRVKEDPEGYLVPSNIARLEDFTESWRADIVTKTNIADGLNNNTLEDNSYSRFIKILPDVCEEDTFGNKAYGINLQLYAKKVLDQANVTTNDVKVTNINPSIEGSCKCIEFRYDLPYNVGEIITSYKTALQTGCRLLLSILYDPTGLPSHWTKLLNLYVPISTLVDNSKLYYYNNDGTVTLIDSKYPFKALHKFVNNNGNITGLYNYESNLDLNKGSDLMNNFQLNGSSLYINAGDDFDKNISKYLLHIVVKGTRDVEVLNLQYTSIFNYAKL